MRGRPLSWLLRIVIAGVAGILACICVIVVLGLILPPAGTPTPVAQVAPTDTAAPTPTSEPLPPPPTAGPQDRLAASLVEALGNSNRDTPRLAGLAVEGGEIVVSWAINDNLTSNLVRTGAALDVVDILQAVDELGIDYQQITVIGSFAMQDVYGNIEESIVVSAVYTRPTVDRIAFDTFDTDNTYRIADELLMLHPEFQP